MRSFSLLRTNPGLTTNTKIIVDSNYNLFLESIDSIPQLSINQLKKYPFTPDNFYDELIPQFFKQTPADTAFAIKYDKDNSNMGSDFSKQYDDIYQMGARNISDNRNYEEEYEFFAPLYVFNQSIPNFFIIFRVDGPGLINLTSDNFRSEIISDLKCVKVIDMTKTSPLGQWIDLNFTTNTSFPPTGFELDFRNLQFSNWHGIDYLHGGYTHYPFFLDETLEIENTIHDLEKFVFNGFQQNKIVFPHIINLSFLFDDYPATPTSLRDWSLNRYYGFYVDQLELIQTVTPFSSKPLYNDCIIGTGNSLYSPTNDTPFVGGYNPNIDYWVELEGSMYQVHTYQEETPQEFYNSQSPTNPNVFTQEFGQTYQTLFRIISDINYTGSQSFLNQNIVYIDSGNNLIKFIDGSYYQVPNFNFADVWLININGVFHRLIQGTNSIQVLTDYAFNFVPDVSFSYYINHPDPNYLTTLNLDLDKNQVVPFSFQIYRLNFTDIKDFDFQIVDNKLSKFEYELANTLTVTDETKEYVTDLRIKSNPQPFDDYTFNNHVVNIPAASDYTANYETFRIEDNDLSDIWRKNPISCRWAYQNSLSAHDYPYLMNNSLIHEDYNRTANTNQLNPVRAERNLDYFYSVNSGTAGYLDHTLHVESNSGSVQDPNFQFRIEDYLNLNGYGFDYFTLFFGMTQSFLNGQIVRNSEKWSYFETGDTSIPNTTVFRGLKFKIFEVDNIKVDNGFIQSVNLESSNNYQDYKFSILLTGQELTPWDAPNIPPNIVWKIIDTWKHDTFYSFGSLAIYQDTVYYCVFNNTSTDPNEFPINTINWIPWSIELPSVRNRSIFWDPMVSPTYSLDKIVYRQGEFYQKTSMTGSTFWNPGFAYNPGDMVISQNKQWECILPSFNQEPSQNQYSTYSYTASNTPLISTYGNWTEVAPTLWEWSVIPLWNPSSTYMLGDVVVHNQTVWTGATTSSISNEEPQLNSPYWSKFYSFIPDNQTIYHTTDPSSVISIDNTYYFLSRRFTPISYIDYLPSGITYSYSLPLHSPVSSGLNLSNGIVIYVNHKYKNVLVTLQINDGTTYNISNATRDQLYLELNSRLTAYNLMQSINDLHTKYGFVNYVTYVIINEDGSINSYNMDIGITGLTSMLVCEDPDLLQVQSNSLILKPETIGTNVLKPSMTLVDGLITSNLSNLNYYNGIPLGSSFDRNQDMATITPNYSGQKNIIHNNMYRHSGYYMPLFYKLEIFEAPILDVIPAHHPIYIPMMGNYRFDTTLTDFGMIKQRIISKVNTSGTILKLKNDTSHPSIWPMLDEFGYTYTDFFIFKSTWDLEYHVQVTNNNT